MLLSGSLAPALSTGMMVGTIELREAQSAAQRADRLTVLAAVADRGWTLMLAAEALRADKDVVLTAVLNEGSALRYLGAGIWIKMHMFRMVAYRTVVYLDADYLAVKPLGALFGVPRFAGSGSNSACTTRRPSPSSSAPGAAAPGG